MITRNTSFPRRCNRCPAPPSPLSPKKRILRSDRSHAVEIPSGFSAVLPSVFHFVCRLRPEQIEPHPSAPNPAQHNGSALWQLPDTGLARARPPFCARTLQARPGFFSRLDSIGPPSPVRVRENPSPDSPRLPSFPADRARVRHRHRPFPSVPDPVGFPFPCPGDSPTPCPTRRISSLLPRPSRPLFHPPGLVPGCGTFSTAFRPPRFLPRAEAGFRDFHRGAETFRSPDNRSRTGRRVGRFAGAFPGPIARFPVGSWRTNGLGESPRIRKETSGAARNESDASVPRPDPGRKNRSPGPENRHFPARRIRRSPRGKGYARPPASARSPTGFNPYERRVS